MIFCNTIESCRAVEYSLSEAGIDISSYHGDLNSKEREANLDSFRRGLKQYLVCSDIAARGIDIPGGESLLIYICNFHVLNYLLMYYICKLHWKFRD